MFGQFEQSVMQQPEAIFVTKEMLFVQRAGCNDIRSVGNENVFGAMMPPQRVMDLVAHLKCCGLTQLLLAEA